MSDDKVEIEVVIQRFRIRAISHFREKMNHKSNIHTYTHEVILDELFEQYMSFREREKEREREK